MGNPKKPCSDKLCGICGNSGFPEEIVTCYKCKKASEHTYCMKSQVHRIPDLWICEECEERSKQPPSRSSYSKTETTKVKFLPFEEVAKLTSGSQTKASSIRRNIGASLLRTNQAHKMCSPISQSATPNQAHKMCSPISQSATPNQAHKMCSPISQSATPNQAHKMCSPISQSATPNQAHKMCSPISQSPTPGSCKTAEVKDSLKIERMNSMSKSSGLQPLSIEPKPRRMIEATQMGKLPLRTSCKSSTFERSIRPEGGPVLPHDAKFKSAEDLTLRATHIEPVDRSFNVASHYPSKHIRPMRSLSVANSSHLHCSNDEWERRMDLTITKEVSATLCSLHDFKEEHIDGHVPVESLNLQRQMSANLLHAGASGERADGQLNKPNFLDISCSPVVCIDESGSNNAVQEPHWRGTFEIRDSETYDGIQAHFPSRVALKAYEASKIMPEILKLSLVQRQDVWPQIFRVDPPTCADIALYFFRNELDRFKEKYHQFLEWIDVHDLAMHCCLDGVELLIFTSNQLPLESQRINSQMYLWGVLRPLKRRRPNRGSYALLPYCIPGSPMRNSQMAPRLPSSEGSSVGLVNLAATWGNSEVVDMEIDMIGGNDIVKKIDRTVTQSIVCGMTGAHNSEIDPDVPPGFSEPMVRDRDDRKRTTFALKKTSSRIPSHITPGFSEPINTKRESGSDVDTYSRRGQSSKERTLEASNSQSSRVASRCHQERAPYNLALLYTEGSQDVELGSSRSSRPSNYFQ